MKRILEDNTEFQDPPKLTKERRFDDYSRFLKPVQQGKGDVEGFLKDLDAEIVKNCTYRRREELENIRFLVLSQKRMDEGKINYQLFLEEYGAQFKTRSELEFTCLQKEIQNTAAKLQNKKFHQAPLELPPERKIERHGKGKGCLGFMKDAKNLEQLLIKERTCLLRNALSENELAAFEQRLIQTLTQAKSNQQLSHKMKLYLISHRVLQKVLELIYEDTRHLSIKRSNIGQYLKMKEEMVAILANEELFMKQLEMINEQQRTRLQSTKVIVRSCEKNSGVKRIYFANERKQEQLVTQIEDALKAAGRLLKEAFLKRQRPDYAYQTQMTMTSKAN